MLFGPFALCDWFQQDLPARRAAIPIGRRSRSFDATVLPVCAVLASAMRRLGHALVVIAAVAAPAAAQRAVQFDLDQPRTALAYLAAQSPNARDSIWRLHIATRGYQRLRQREAAMNRAFTDSSFRAFLDSDTLRARGAQLNTALKAWGAADYADAERRALQYLPQGTRIAATVFIMIKPRTNSFVFDVNRDPAIFLYLDPAVDAAKFTNTATHELHHIGLASACAEKPAASGAVGTARQWLSAFGEGWAMLAAAGAADVHPHVVSDTTERARWDRDLAQAPKDLVRLEQFFGGVLSGSISADSANTAGFSFFSERPQGPWYTVGWLMVSEVERSDGRAALVRLACDPVGVVRRYHQLRSRSSRPNWSDDFIRTLDILTDRLPGS